MHHWHASSISYTWWKFYEIRVIMGLENYHEHKKSWKENWGPDFTCQICKALFLAGEIFAHKITSLHTCVCKIKGHPHSHRYINSCAKKRRFLTHDIVLGNYNLHTLSFMIMYLKLNQHKENAIWFHKMS